MVPPNSHRLAGALTPASSRLGARGFPEWGAVLREVPRLLHFSIYPSWKLSHGRTLPLPWEGRSPGRTLHPNNSNETRTLGPQNPVCIPCGHLWSLRNSKPSPTSLLGVHGRFWMAPGPRSPTVSRWPGAFGTGPAGLQAHCQRLWPWFRLLSAPPARPVPAS